MITCLIPTYAQKNRTLLSTHCFSLGLAIRANFTYLDLLSSFLGICEGDQYRPTIKRKRVSAQPIPNPEYNTTKPHSRSNVQERIGIVMVIENGSKNNKNNTYIIIPTSHSKVSRLRRKLEKRDVVQGRVCHFGVLLGPSVAADVLSR